MRERPREEQPEIAPRPHAPGVLAQLAERALGASRYGALQGVVCDELGGVIRLGGRVPSQYLKQVAFATVCEVVGSRPILNQIEVVCGTTSLSASSASSGWYRIGSGLPVAKAGRLSRQS